MNPIQKLQALRLVQDRLAFVRAVLVELVKAYGPELQPDVIALLQPVDNAAAQAEQALRDGNKKVAITDADKLAFVDAIVAAAKGEAAPAPAAPEKPKLEAVK